MRSDRQRPRTLGGLSGRLSLDRRALVVGLLVTLELLNGCASAPPIVQEVPDWVEHNGISDRFPRERFRTGFAMAEGDSALDIAKQEAAADLTKQISLNIETELQDVTEQKDGRIAYHVASRTRTTSRIRLEGVTYETYTRGRRAYALAILRRAAASASRAKQRDRAIAATRSCLSSAQDAEKTGRTSEALKRYRACRTPLSEAGEHESVRSVLWMSTPADEAAYKEILALTRRIEERESALPHEPARTPRQAAERLALQLEEGGVSRSQKLEIPPFTYGLRNVSSEFGRAMAEELRRAMASQPGGGDTPVALRGDDDPRIAVLRGTYSDTGDDIRVTVSGRQGENGHLLASADVSFPKSALPKGLELKPSNYQVFVGDQDVLGKGEAISGDLRVELWTNRGDRDLVFEEGDALKLYMRVNQPAWLRLVYVLQNGMHVPIEQELYIDASKVNQVVEYPAELEIAGPFGAEMIHVSAFTERPPRMRTRQVVLDGQPYEVAAGGAEETVRTRGFVRKQKKAEMAEETLTLTTMPKLRNLDAFPN